MASAPGGGRLAAIFVGPVAAEPMMSVDEVLAVAGGGLEGDRYADRRGTWSERPGTGRQVTLVEREAVDAVNRDYGLALDPSSTRRNLLTEGVALNHLVGREFRVGAVLLRGMRLCEPCRHLEDLTAEGARRAFVHRGGLRADIVEGGTLRVGDAIVTPNFVG